jgi:nitrite reductase/ring-hydroxylating ferredoxin subunit
MKTVESGHYVRAARVEDLQAAGCVVAQVNGHALAFFSHGGRVYAVDNRCPHMGFPLQRGSVHDGILTCHWHHARFDLATGGTFDPWADDVRAFPVEIRDGEIWVDVTPHGDPRAHHNRRLREGLERTLPLVIAKAAVSLVGDGADPTAAFRIGLEFGARYRRDGWGQGLTIHGCMMNLVPALGAEDRPLALYHGLSAVAANSDGMAPRFPLEPLPGSTTDIGTLKRWFRQFVEVRDAEGAERCIASAVQSGAGDRALAGMLFAAATDHRYIDTGHVLDFINKGFEALDVAGWDHAGLVLSSFSPALTAADRMEESNTWRHPVDLVAILEAAFDQLPAAAEEGKGLDPGSWDGRAALIPVLLGEDARAIAGALLDALREGAGFDEIAGAVAYAAALRIAHFPTSNEFGDWDTALHTFTFANAVHQGLRRAPSIELLRGAFDAAAGVYLDRFLNVPQVPLPQAQEELEASGAIDDEIAGELLDDLGALLDRQQRVNEAGRLVARHLYGHGDPDRLLATLGRLLLREDRNFHTIQAVEAAARQFALMRATPPAGVIDGEMAIAPGAVNVLVAAARYLAAHSPTVRAQGQTFRIAQRLHRGERLFEEDPS